MGSPRAWRCLLLARTGRNSRLSSWLFLRLLGFCLATAGWSLAAQVEGLIGERGIWPAASVMKWAEDTGVSFHHFPTLAWFSASDGFLAGLCWCAAVSGVTLMLGILPWFSILSGLICYGSMVRVGGPFLSFQWDFLLLETLFLALFLQPIRQWRPGGWRSFQPRSIGLLLVQVLTFKLMLSSGLVKLSSGDPAWRNGTALTHHFWTQPLPVWTAWYANRLPVVVLKAMHWGMFAIELLAPLLFFASRRFRGWAGVSFIALMVFIAATGNYTFFNLLTVALSITWLDDRFLGAIWEKILRRPQSSCAQTNLTTEISVSTNHLVRPWFSLFIGCVLIPCMLFQTLATTRLAIFQKMIPPWRWVLTVLQPVGLANGYGLFAVMTTRRPEISIELSPDGNLWLPVEFRHKPGNLYRPPAFIAPHQPRLDWQMWFAALADQDPEPWRQNAWLVNLLQRILERSPRVLELMSNVPDGQPPPRFARCLLYYYEFASPAEHEADGSWWRISGGPRLFIPPISLR